MWLGDQLVSLETGILAKEKGYNQNPYITKDAYGPTYTDGSDIRLRSSSLFNPDTNTCVAPTQTALQRWLREKHNLKVFCVSTNKNNVESWRCMISINKVAKLRQPFSSYEEALEDGLQEALKVI